MVGGREVRQEGENGGGVGGRAGGREGTGRQEVERMKYEGGEE